MVERPRTRRREWDDANGKRIGIDTECQWNKGAAAKTAREAALYR
jgi:hypothetical protein